MEQNTCAALRELASGGVQGRQRTAGGKAQAQWGPSGPQLLLSASWELWESFEQRRVLT